MIRLRGKTEETNTNNKIIFHPRNKFLKRVKEMEYPLIYGHSCPYCNNVIQALFKAPSTFSLWPYEETILLSKGEKNAGDIRKVYPDENTKPGKSCYRMDFNSAEGGSIKLTLKNHIIRPRAIVDRDPVDGSGLWEIGAERPCTHAGIFSVKEDLLLKDWLLFSQTTGCLALETINKYKFPSIKTIIKEDNLDFKLTLAIGAAPPIILIDNKYLVYGFTHPINKLILPYYNK